MYLFIYLCINLFNYPSIYLSFFAYRYLELYINIKFILIQIIFIRLSICNYSSLQCLPFICMLHELVRDLKEHMVIKMCKIYLPLLHIYQSTDIFSAF